MAKFTRRNPDSGGTYQAFFREKNGSAEHISISGRSIYETDDKRKIEFLRNDPEISEVITKTRIETVPSSDK